MSTEMTPRPLLTPDQLVADYEAYKLRQSHGGSMAAANWVTALAHRCEAFAIFNRIVPPEGRRKIEAGLAMVFSEGNDQARAIKRDLLDAGYDIEGEEGQMSWGRYQITGRKDFALKRNGSQRVRVETKSCTPWIFDKLNTPADVRKHKSEWVRKWDRQVILYAVLQGVDRYWMLLKNKVTGRVKVIEYVIGAEELQIAEEMIAKAERVNQLVTIERVPIEQVPSTAKLAEVDVCTECEFLAVCNPPLTFGPGARVVDEALAAELAARADRWAELRPGAAEFGELDEELKEELKRIAGESEHVVFGNWIATLKKIEGTDKRKAQIRVTLSKT